MDSKHFLPALVSEALCAILPKACLAAQTVRAAGLDTQPRIVLMLLEQPWGGGHGQAEPAVTLTLASSFTSHDLSTEGSPQGRTLGLAVVQRPGRGQARQGPEPPADLCTDPSRSIGDVGLRFGQEQDFGKRL